MDNSHILIIEDDSSVCELLFTCLSKAGYRVSIAQSGEAGLSQIDEDPPEAVVLDLNLPGMNGLDVCRAMRRDPWMSRIPVLMLTGQAEEDDVVAGLEVGADDYMTKPFSPKLLTARVKSLLRRRSSNPNPADGTTSSENSPESLMVKTLGRCELRVGNRSLSWTEEFSPAQRQLMAMLVGASSGKISQEELQASLWPDSTSTRARSSFDSLLSRVRRTLDQALAPFDSKKYLVVKRGYLCLEHSLIDAHEFRRLIRKANQQNSAGELWPAEITFSSAFSLWRGTFVPGDFGSDEAIIFQDELEQLYLDSSQTFARLLAQNERYQEAAKLLRDALRYEPTNDGIVRLLYSLYLAQESPGKASQIIKQYSEALARENFPAHEIEVALLGFPK
ncbi:MAG: response regulator [Desulfuromonadales bacterium]|jgi:two-component system phosphate regulon response regulator PhoB|nr:response regulator [Desulfuromonadales bacterium]MDH3808657.1 response regulator [Desulfuromonadales bacterium]MDH3961080.1 response regulator [Desulfuromonadales bacterium]